MDKLFQLCFAFAMFHKSSTQIYDTMSRSRPLSPVVATESVADG